MDFSFNPLTENTEATLDSPTCVYGRMTLPFIDTKYRRVDKVHDHWMELTPSLVKYQCCTDGAAWDADTDTWAEAKHKNWRTTFPARNIASISLWFESAVMKWAVDIVVKGNDQTIDIHFDKAADAKALYTLLSLYLEAVNS